jgi:hypothetical protein
MRGFQEVKGHNIRLVYDREHADFVAKVEPHLFLVRKPESEVESGHNGGNGKVLARRDKC